MVYPSDPHAHRMSGYATDYEQAVPAWRPGHCSRDCAVRAVVGGSWKTQAWRIGHGSYSRAAVVAVASKKQNNDQHDYDPIAALVVAECGDTELVQGAEGVGSNSDSQGTR